MTRDALAALVLLGILGLVATTAYCFGYVKGHQVATDRAESLQRAMRTLRNTWDD